MSHPSSPWGKHDKLIGRTIINVENMTDKESAYWGVGAIVLQLDDGKRWWLSSDTEGNYGGDIHPVEDEENGFISSLCPISTGQMDELFYGEEYEEGRRVIITAANITAADELFRSHFQIEEDEEYTLYCIGKAKPSIIELPNR